jgi:thiol-disulfide isomerase/thioredoxin
MKRMLMIMLVMGLIGSAAVAKDTAPKIKIVTADVDLGEVEKNKIFDFDIEVKNVGEEELVITSVSSSCGCLELTGVAAELALPQGDDGKASFAATAHDGKASFAATAHDGKVNFAATPGGSAVEPVTVKPNHSIYITAKVDTSKVAGDFEKMIHVYSNDPENKDAVWKVRGRVMDVAAELALPQGDDGKASFAATARDSQSREDAKIIMLFYSPGCRECEEIMEKFLPEIKKKYSDKILIVDYNIDNMQSYEFFLELQNKYDERAKKGFFNPKPPAVFAGNRLLYGVKEIEKGLEELIR